MQFGVQSFLRGEYLKAGQGGRGEEVETDDAIQKVFRKGPGLSHYPWPCDSRTHRGAQSCRSKRGRVGIHRPLRTQTWPPYTRSSTTSTPACSSDGVLFAVLVAVPSAAALLV